MENMSSSLSSSSMQHFPFTPFQFDDIFNHGVAICNIYPERTDREPEWNEGVYDNLGSWPFSLDSNNLPSSFTMEKQSSFVHSASNTSLCEEVEETVDTNGEVGSCLDDSAMVASSTEFPTPDPLAVDKGLELVNLLLACAEAVGCRDTSVAAATLNQLWLLANPNGDSLQRVSFCFAVGLRSRLSLLKTVGSNGSFSSTAIGMDSAAVVITEEKLEAFHNLYQTTPYISFGFMAANEAIYHAAQGKDRLHIVDLGMSHALQWPSLVQMLISRPGRPPNIRITGVASPGTNLSELVSTMGLLINEARRISVPVEFRVLHESSSPALLTTETLQLRQGEVLFVNSMMHLHKYVKESRGSLKAVLVAIKKLKPALVTVVEQDANHNGPFFLARFLESLHYYSAVFDSLEASLARPSAQRMKIESGYFLEEITNIIACEGGERVERHERADQWQRQLGRAGFQGVALKSINQARMLVSSYGCDGYTVGSEKGCLLLGWKGRPIMWASAWQVNPASSSSC